MERRRPRHRPAQDQSRSLISRPPSRPRSAPQSVRLQKFLADAGVASRRKAEELIQAGRVWVNGVPVTQLGTKVHPIHDHVLLDGHRLKPRRKLYVALHKPAGYLCTRADPQSRRTLYTLLPKEWTHLYTVGRLDNQSEGLIFLTNDGEFALRVSHPRYRIHKTYRVTFPGPADPGLLQCLTHGVVDLGEPLKAIQARVISSHQTQSVIELDLAEGKYREVRRLCAACGLSITRLQRIRIGPIKLGELPAGKWRTLTEPEINSLLQSL